jgi:hypothetical protein
MPLFQAVRRAKRWPVVIPIYDGRRCPDCGALVLGDKGQDLHRAHHEAQLHWQEAITEALRQTATGAGLSVGEDAGGGEIAGLDLQADEEHDRNRRVSWRTLATRTADDDDERLTAKVRRALRGNEYDDDDDE